MTWKLLSCVTLAFTLAIGTIVQANSEDKQGTERISQPREFSGIWLVEFEGSTFFEGAENPPNEIVWGTEHGVWLKWNGESGLTKADLAHDPELGCYPVYPFRLTFVGQERTGGRGYGHMGYRTSEVVVQRMIHLEPIGEGYCYRNGGIEGAIKAIRAARELSHQKIE